MKKVYIIIGGWNYEGYALPEGVYSTRAKAETMLKKVKSGYDGKPEIVEYELNADPEFR